MWNVAHITTRVYKSTLIIGVVSVHGYTISWNMAMISMYREEIRLLSRQEVVEERKQLFRLLNGDAFFPEKSWPKDIRLIFWKKPMGDKETFKLLLFFHGNGCTPEIISRWILLAQSWASSLATAEKRARQMQFVKDNVDIKYINGFTTTLIIANWCTSMGYHDKPHVNSQKWLQSLEYKTALLGATAWYNHPFRKLFIENLFWFKRFLVDNEIVLRNVRS